MLVDSKRNPRTGSEEPGNGRREIWLCVCVKRDLLIGERVLIELRRM